MFTSWEQTQEQLQEQRNLADVREFLSALSPSELHRMVDLFRMQLNLAPLPTGIQPIICNGLPRQTPNSRALTAKAGS